MSALPNVLTMPGIGPKKRVVRSRCAHLEAEQLEAFMAAAKAHGAKRTALFLKEEQLKKLQMLSNKTGAPVAELIRRAIHNYLRERATELK